MKMKNKNEGEDSLILRRNSHKMCMSAILMFAVALLAMTAVSITDSGESDAATGTVVSGTADITINVSAWDDTQDLVFVATYNGTESYVQITAANATSGSAIIHVTGILTYSLGPATFRITATDLAAASLSSGATITITFTYVVYDEVIVTDAGGNFTMSSWTNVLMESGSYYKVRGEPGSISFTLSPSNPGYYRSTGIFSGGTSAYMDVYTTDLTVFLDNTLVLHTFDLIAVEMYEVTVGILNPMEYSVTFVPSIIYSSPGNGFRNVTGNVGYVDAGYTGTFTVGTALGDPYYRITGITDLDTPYVPGIFDTAVTCTVETPTDSTTVVGITVTEMYKVTVGDGIGYDVIFTEATHSSVGPGFRGLSSNVAYIDAGFIGNFEINTIFVDPYYRLVDVTGIYIPYVPPLFETTAIGTVTPTASMIVGVTVEEMYAITVGAATPIGYDVVYQASVDETPGDGFRTAFGKGVFIDAGYSGTFTVSTIISGPYYRILDITFVDVPYIPGIFEVTATCTVTPADSARVVGITVTEMYAVTVGILNPTDYTVTFALAADETVGNGFRNVTDNIGYVDATYIGTFTVDTVFATPDYYRLAEITFIDVAYVPGILDITATGSVTPADSTIVVGITAIPMYEITFSAGTGTSYYPGLATTHNVGDNGFRQDPFTAAVDVFYVDVVCTPHTSTRNLISQVLTTG